MLEPLAFEHTNELAEICRRGDFGKIRITSTPNFSNVKEYIEKALNQKERGIRYPFAIFDERTKQLIGTTSYHDILHSAKRVEIGNTWYDINF